MKRNACLFLIILLFLWIPNLFSQESGKSAPVYDDIITREKCLNSNLDLDQLDKSLVTSFSTDLNEYFTTRAIVSMDRLECNKLNDYWAKFCQQMYDRYYFWISLINNIPVDLKMLDSCSRSMQMDKPQCSRFISAFQKQDLSYCGNNEKCISLFKLDARAGNSQEDRNFFMIMKAYRSSDPSLCQSLASANTPLVSQEFCTALVTSDPGKCESFISESTKRKIKEGYCHGLPTEKELLETRR